MDRLISLIGLFILMGIAWLFCDNRRRVDWRLVVWGVGLQFAFAVIILKTGVGYIVFDFARIVMTRVLDYTDIGSRFMFGTLVSDYNIGAIFAFKVLPVIIFVSSLMGVLYHFGVIQAVVKVMAAVMQRTMRASGAEALMSAMFVFMGIEAATGVKDYIKKMTRSELFTVMTGFMATIAGSVMAVYVSFGASAGHILAASVMSAPAAIAISKLMVPEVEESVTGDAMKASIKTDGVNVIEAAANGAADGLRLAATIGAMMLAFIALIGMMNDILSNVNVSFEELMGYAFTPFAFIMGVPWEECFNAGQLLGIKTVFNEFISYQKMQGMIASGALSPRSVTIMTYALCGFANFGSIAILIGGIGSIAPERKKDVARLSLRALVSGTIASFMTAAIAGVLI